MRTPTTRRSLFAAALILSAMEARAVEPPARNLAGLSKDQLRALGDQEPVTFNGKVTTKAQIKADLEKGRSALRADLQAQVRGKLAAFEQMKARNLTVQNEKARALKATALAEAGRIATNVPTPAPKATPAPPQDPKISSVGAAYVMPGSSFMVAGEGLGSSAGTARLEGQFPGGGQNLIVEIWKPNLAVLTVPEGVSGVIRQTARVALKRADGKAANTLPVLFEPMTDMKVLPSHDLIVVCSLGADLNNCDPLPNQTFEGTHANTIDITSDTGLDKFKANLKNGWVVESWDFVQGGFTIGIGKGYSTNLSGLTAGLSTFDIHVSFDVNPATNLEYYGLVYIRGPVGTSHK